MCIRDSYLTGTCQPLTCLRNVETCTALQCKSDEDCYLKEDTDASGKSVTVTPVCAKRDPCADKKCNDNERCAPIFAEDQPPYAKCESTAFVDQCKDIKCPDNYRCILNFSYCYGMPCATQAACADISPCKDCSFTQFCEMEPAPPKTADGVALFKGVCVTFNISLPFQ